MGEIIETRVEKALQLHKDGYNCAQAVVCAYCDLFDLDEETAFKMSEGFGYGMGGLMETCGAVSGMFMLAGFSNSSGRAKDKTIKQTYPLVKTLGRSFAEKNGSLICRTLKGKDGGEILRSCDGCIQDCAELIEKFLLTQLQITDII